MIYKVTIFIVRILLILLNGFSKVMGRENLPEDTGYVIVAPHRSWLDPVLIAIAVYPKSLVLMAKQELFKPKPFDWFIRQLGAFPVNREKPGPSAIKHPVTQIKEHQKALVIFPTGTRYSNEMKGGAVTIARMAKAPIVPIVYQGPFTFMDILKRQKMFVKIGEPIHLPEGRLSKEELAQYDELLIQKFDELDKEINPNFVYVIPEKKRK